MSADPPSVMALMKATREVHVRASVVSRVLLAGIASALVLGTMVIPVSGIASGTESPSASEAVVTTAETTKRLRKIRRTAAQAGIWALAPEFSYRFNRYNKLVTAPYNTIAYAPYAAQWDDASTNAGNASVIYLNSSLSLKRQDLVFTVPLTNGTFQMIQVLDAFVNTVADPGTRTTPTDETAHYLVVGPESKYAKLTEAVIDGRTFPVISIGTNRGEILARVLGDPNAPPSDPRSFASSFENVAKKYALNTLEDFSRNGYAPVYPTGPYAYQIPPVSPEQAQRAAKWRNVPDNAVAFFEQAGAALRLSPLPRRGTGIGGTSAADLPSYVPPQPGFDGVYHSPSSGQRATLKSFASIGLTARGYRVPRGWGEAELTALQQGFTAGLTAAKVRLLQATTAETNYWLYVNRDDEFGTYANTPIGYLGRASAIFAGGFPNLPSDGFYATQLREGGGPNPLQGDNTYNITFQPEDAAGGVLPADGILPPIATDADGNLLGFWSMTIYQTDFTEAAAPFISQASVLNTAYSQAETTVYAIDTEVATITVAASAVGPLRAGTAIMFSDNASGFGLESDKAYFVATSPVTNAAGSIPGIDVVTYTFPIAETWQQELSSVGTPIQQVNAETSTPQGAIVSLTTPQSPDSPLAFGVVQPVSQLGSLQIESKDKGGVGLEPNEDGSYTIWLAPALPAGVAATNWIPTPSQEYLQAIYPGVETLNSEIQPILRMYYARSGSQPPSILPCPAGTTGCGTGLATTYVIPEIVNHSVL